MMTDQWKIVFADNSCLLWCRDSICIENIISHNAICHFDENFCDFDGSFIFSVL